MLLYEEDFSQLALYFELNYLGKLEIEDYSSYFIVFIADCEVLMEGPCRYQK